MKVTIKIVKRDGTTFCPSRTEKRKVARLTSTETMKSGYLKVTYQPGVYNDGTFYNKADLMAAYDAWTEPSSVKHCTEGEW